MNRNRCFFALALLLCVFAAQAQADQKAYTVRSGDTLDRVFREHGCLTQEDFFGANLEKNNWPNLRVGETLIVPYWSPAEVKSMQDEIARLDTELKASAAAVGVLTSERNEARVVGQEWREQYDAAAPLAKQAGNRLMIMLGLFAALAAIVAASAVYFTHARSALKRQNERVAELEKINKELRGDPAGWQRIYAQAQARLARIGLLKSEDRQELLKLFDRIELMPGAEQRALIVRFVEERATLARNTSPAPRIPLVSVPAPKKL